MADKEKVVVTKAAAPPPQPIDWDVTEFVRNPGGAIHDIPPSHPAHALAIRNHSGWRLATEQEARDYCKVHNIDPDGLEDYGAHARKLQREAEKADRVAAGDEAQILEARAEQGGGGENQPQTRTVTTATTASGSAEANAKAAALKEEQEKEERKTAKK